MKIRIDATVDIPDEDVPKLIKAAKDAGFDFDATYDHYNRNTHRTLLRRMLTSAVYSELTRRTESAGS